MSAMPVGYVHCPSFLPVEAHGPLFELVQDVLVQYVKCTRARKRPGVHEWDRWSRRKYRGRLWSILHDMQTDAGQASAANGQV